MHRAAIHRGLFMLALIILAFSGPAHADSPRPGRFLVEVADLGTSRELADLLTARGYAAIVLPGNARVTNEQNNCAVWIGRRVPLEMLRTVLPEALRHYPYLQFFYVVGDRGETPPERVHDTIHIGGSIEAALVMKLNSIPPAELLRILDQSRTLEELHEILHHRNLARPGPAVGNS